YSLIRLVKNMRKFWTVFSHTYLSKLKSKSFIITTLIVLILMAGVSNIDHIIDLFSGEDNADEVIVIDHSNDALDPLVNMSANKESGVDAETLENIYADMTFEHVALDESAKTEEELNSTRGIIYVMLFVLYITVLLYGQMIATEVATEKSSRVMEILISSASP